MRVARRQKGNNGGIKTSPHSRVKYGISRICQVSEVCPKMCVLRKCQTRSGMGPSIE